MLAINISENDLDLEEILVGYGRIIIQSGFLMCYLDPIHLEFHVSVSWAISVHISNYITV